jgi:hypothetical protein
MDLLEFKYFSRQEAKSAKFGIIISLAAFASLREIFRDLPRSGFPKNQLKEVANG